MGIVHHSHDLECSLCTQKLTAAHPKIGFYFNLIKKQFPTVHISQTFRNQSDQNEAVISGKSKLTWPKSKHNFMVGGPPCSKAMDLFELEGSRAKFDPKFYLDITEWCKKQGFKLTYGIDWVTMHDSDHIELLEPV